MTVHVQYLITLNIRTLRVQGVPRTHGTQKEGIKDAF
jgi:hypothetical protein